MKAVVDNYPWFALQTRSRYEHFVAAMLRGKGYELFLPVYTCQRRWSDRIKELELPLFPGYLFCRFNPLDRFPILVTPGVIQVRLTTRKSLLSRPPFNLGCLDNLGLSCKSGKG